MGISRRFPDLTQLSEFLTGQNSEPRWSFPWSRSQEVNVTVVDIEPSVHVPNPGLRSVRHIGDICSLRKEVLKIRDDLIMKLFLVEDMVAPVVDLLGSAFKCQPDFFGNHMLYRGNLWRQPVPEAGNNGGPRGSPIIDNTTYSSILQRAYFSIPYRRYSENHEGCTRLQKQRTMFRSYNELESVLEELVTGGLFAGSNGAQVGMASPILSDSRSPILSCIGILLFDSSLEEVFSNHLNSLFETIPQYSAVRLLASAVTSSTSTRSVFLQGLGSYAIRDRSEDLGSLILRPLLGIIRHEWRKIVGNASYFIYDGVDLKDVDDYLLQINKNTQDVLTENLSMLKETVNLVHHGGIQNYGQPRGSDATQTLRECFEEDFKDLLSRTKECIEQNWRNQGLVNTLTAIQDARNGLELTRQAVEESKRGIELSKRALNQADNIQYVFQFPDFRFGEKFPRAPLKQLTVIFFTRALTSLATFYIPLSPSCAPSSE